MGAGILFAGRPQDARIAPLLGKHTDAVDELLADSGRARIARDIEFLEIQAVRQLRAGEVGVEDGEAHQPASVLFRHQAQGTARRRFDQEGCARGTGPVGNGVAVVALVVLQEEGELGLVSTSCVPDLHGDSSNIAGPGEQRRSKSCH